MRGRNNRGKGPNPLTRSYESNGPDVKIRGTAQHIADKYAQLARDAQASGDPVAAENYLQHAEHYYRIIAAAQEQFRDQFGGGFQRPFDEDGGDEDTGTSVNGHAYSPGPQGGPQGDDGDPAGQPQPYENRGENGERGERPQRYDRNERFDRGDRQDRGGADRQDRGDRFQQRPPRQEFQNGAPRQDRQDRPDRDFRRDRGPREEPEAEINGGLPAFLTTPVRTPIAIEEGEARDAGAAAPGAPDDAAGDPNGRFGRRRRRRRPFDGGEGSEPAADFAPEGAETPPAE
jgi:hypothetical protein